MPRKCMDVSVMKQMGFQPRIPLERGIQEMVGLYREHGRKGNK
jgi:nucleoside-diphosphate-sugar epimerase